MASSLVPLMVIAVCIIGLVLTTPHKEKEIARARRGAELNHMLGEIQREVNHLWPEAHHDDDHEYKCSSNIFRPTNYHDDNFHDGAGSSCECHGEW